MGNNTFNLKDISNFNLFSPTDPANIKQEINNIELRYLKHYANHPFKLYTGERLDDMVESIKASGIFSPLIVREIPGDNFNYEVLSGHNRLEASRIAGLEYVPCIIKKEISEEEAMLIVTESNLIQRSFSDLTHSERAAVLAGHHEAMKQQGKRTDLINEIENLLKASDGAENSTSAPVGRKLETREIVGQDYNLSKNTVARYLHINTLIPEHKGRLDSGELPIRAAVDLSYLSESEQETVSILLDTDLGKLDMKKAEALRKLSEDRKFTEEMAEDIISGKKAAKKSTKPPSVKLKAKVVAKYFKAEQEPKEIEDTIIKALEFYFANADTENTTHDDMVDVDTITEAQDSEDELDKAFDNITGEDYSNNIGQ